MAHGILWLVTMIMLVGRVGSEEKSFALQLSATDLEVLSIFEIYPLMFLTSFSPLTKILVVSTLATVWLIAISGKYAIISTLFRTGIMSRPINILMLVDQIINTMHRSTSLWVSILSMVLDNALGYYFGPLFCKIYNGFVIFGVSYGVIGSFGITLFRVMHLKASLSQITSNSGWTWTAIKILTFTLGFDTLLTFGFLHNLEGQSYHTTLCNGNSAEFLHILAEYEDLGKSRLKIYVLVTLLIVGNLEAMGYGYFLHHIYTHDKNMTKVLRAQVIKRRHQKTTISFACEMYCYILECIGLVALIVCFRVNYGFNYVNFLWQFEFAIKSIVQAMSLSQSRETYIFCIAQMKWLLRWLKKVPFKLLLLAMRVGSRSNGSDGIPTLSQDEQVMTECSQRENQIIKKLFSSHQNLDKL